MKAMLRDQSALKPELFEYVHWYMAEYLWDALKRCNKQTMHMWKIMASVYPVQFYKVSPYYCLSAGCPKKPLRDYMGILNSEDFRWRAILTIATTYCTATDLTTIPNIKNLVALDVHNEPYTSNNAPLHPVGVNNDGLLLQDGFVRGWIESKALRHLRILRFYHQHEMTVASLAALRELPELQLVVAYECKKITETIQKYDKPANGVIPVKGWSACRLDWFWENHGTSKTIDDNLLALHHVYQSSLQTPGEDSRRPSSLPTNLPILEFKLPTVDHSKRDRVVVRSRYNAKSIVLFTRDPVKQKLDIKKQQRAREKKKRTEPPEKGDHPAKRAVMKERGPMDISETLNQFF
ncbi:hypothetical protein N7489_006229 [Penicillium chrysogenum]|nr:uncharacterized protein N7525_000351 [Penicillium rubens]XP_056565694.1 uncharacterized protein N7489_006229 [Penicillium chrysogenum]KAJ5039901.1 hypothetical protein NUH16_009694 [Penicillium rubens]KAJ5236138.1 hypothetical protein N7489_006229 [Penicillium chrysogenum]KAJ5276078.1 hypothetical protein N7524_002231 [Penicillium chrysogenum]KAJ5842610.1 hypothetical protein N7525_000351 [Penicillium rubens]KAJ5846819.1 hypothetical protein N7534_010488 [Penicillium rubens]